MTRRVATGGEHQKVFDELKTKLAEQRSWTSSKEAKTAHALFLCLSHKLMLLFENHLQRNESMRDEVEPQKKETRQKTERKGWRKKLVPSYINSFFKRATQRTFRFIRWLRDALSKRPPYSDSLADLAHVWGCEIT